MRYKNLLVLIFRLKHSAVFLSSFFLIFSFDDGLKAQTAYSSSAAYGLRKLNTSYTGSAIRVRRACDDAVKDIGFNSCGELDTVALKAFVIAANPLTALTTSAAAAYSLRKIRCAYSGNAIRVRSSGIGTPTLDIGFTASGDLDTVALKVFIGLNSGFVTIWYDQSGNGHDAFQVTATSQPRIVNAGTVDRQGSMPAIRWLGAGYGLATAPFTGYALAACFNGVAKVNSDLTYNTFVNKTNGNLPGPLDFYNNQVVIGNGTTYNFQTYSQNFNAANTYAIWTFQSSIGLVYNFYYNGSSAGSGLTGFYGDSGNQLSLGTRSDGLTGLDGWISEVVTFPLFPTTSERQFLEWSQSQYYGISGPTLTTFPPSLNSGYVTIWYDQSGNNLDAIQATAAHQPRIVNAGTVEKNGTVPAIHFGGALQNLVAPISALLYPVTISLLANTGGSSTNGAFVKMGNSNTNSADGGIAIGVGNSGGTFDNTGTSVIGLKEWSVWCPSSPNINYPSTHFVSTTVQQPLTTMSTYLNGANVPLTAASNSVGLTISGSLFLGGYTNVSDRYPLVKESEVAIYNFSLSSTQRVLIETNQGSHYNTAVTGSKYTPPSASAYNRYIVGIGRETATDSVSYTRATGGMGFIAAGTATDYLKNNGDYITAGTGCLASSSSTLNMPAGIVSRWTNDWYINKTDVGSNNGIMTIFFDFGDYGVSILPGVPANYELLGRATTGSNFSIITTTKSVVGDRVFFTLNASAITTNNYYTIGTKSAVLSPLPVELLSFDAICGDGVVNVSWATQIQVNNDFFSIERTSNGQDYEVVNKVEGEGYTSKPQHYTFKDMSPLPGTSYYRLKQTDGNGASNYFKVVAVKCPDADGAISVYPNPTTGQFTVEGAKMNTTITIYNAMGELVASQVALSARQSISLDHLMEGVYFLKAESLTPSVTKLVIER